MERREFWVGDGVEAGVGFGCADRDHPRAFVHNPFEPAGAGPGQDFEACT